MNTKILYIIIGILLTLLLLITIKLVEAKTSQLETIKEQIDIATTEVLMFKKEEKDLENKLNTVKQKKERAIRKNNCLSLNGELILKNKPQLDCGNVEKYATSNLSSIREELGL